MLLRREADRQAMYGFVIVVLGVGRHGEYIIASFCTTLHHSGETASFSFKNHRSESFSVEAPACEFKCYVTVIYFTDARAAAIIRLTAGNFRLLQRLFMQIERIASINEIAAITEDVVEAAAQTLVIGSAN